jgi:hypothetical protein
VVATAAFGVMWGLGALGGSAITGWLMAMLGAVGLPVSIALLCAFLLAALLQASPKRLAAGRAGLGESIHAPLE